MDSELKIELIKGSIEILSVILAASLVILFAVWRIRRERAFERRLSWCESLITELNVAGSFVVSAMRPEGRNSETQETCWTEALRAYQRLIPLCGQKEMYAAPDAVQAIQQFMVQFQKLLEIHFSTHSDANVVDNCQKCIEALQRAAAALSREARKHLGMRALKPDLIDDKYRFVGSFSGRDVADHRDAFEKPENAT